MEPRRRISKLPLLKECSRCGVNISGNDFIKTQSWMYGDGLIPVCNSCIKTYMIEHEWEWSAVDKLCQLIDIPFIPKEFERLREINDDNVFPIYANIFNESPYEGLSWKEYYKEFKELRDLKLLRKELPEIKEAEIKRLKAKWGSNYDEEKLYYLEDLHSGLLTTQNVSGALQMDQAKKLCKASLNINELIDEGEDFSKAMQAYEKLIKTAGFTPKNAKNVNDFDTFGEVVMWKERRGWINEYFDGVPRDIADEVIQNLQSFNRRLYVGESGIGEEVTGRIEALKVAEEIESHYDIDKLETDFDAYENEGFEGLDYDGDFIVEEDDDLSSLTRRI